MSRIELPDNQWAELADPRKVSERKRRPWLDAMSEFYDSRSTTEGGDRIGAAQQKLWNAAARLAMECMVSSWSFGTEITLDALLDLPLDAFDALQVAVTPLAMQMLPDYSPDPDPKAITAESSTSPPDSPADK